MNTSRFASIARVLALGATVTLGVTLAVDRTRAQDAPSDRDPPPARERTRDGAGDTRENQRYEGRDRGTIRRDRESRGPDALSPRQRRLVLEVVRDLQPADADLGERDLREVPDERLQEALRRHGRTVLLLARLREQQPELYEARVTELRLERSARRLAERHAEAQVSGNTELTASVEARLRDVLAEQHDAATRARQIELRVLEERAEALRRQIQERRERRDAILDRRLEELLRARPAGDARDRRDPPAEGDGA